MLTATPSPPLSERINRTIAAARHVLAAPKVVLIMRLISWGLFLLGAYYLGRQIYFQYRRFDSPDLWPLYGAAVMLRRGLTEAIYAHDPVHFDLIRHPYWDSIAADQGYRGGISHPYLYAPIVAYVTIPLTERYSFVRFADGFLIANIVALLGSGFFCARGFCSRTLHPLIILAGTWLMTKTMPAQSGLFLNQTSPLIFGITTLACFLYINNWLRLAGCILALAATVKITPLLVGVLWLFGGSRRRAGWWFLGATAVIACASIWTTGLLLNQYFAINLQRIGSQSFIFYLNNSFVAMRLRWNLDAWHTLYGPVSLLPKPHVSYLNYGLAASTLALGLLKVRTIRKRGLCSARFECAFAMIASTVFCSIAWNHYFLCLFPALWLLWGLCRSSPAWAILAGICVALMLPPFAPPAHAVRWTSWLFLEGLLASAFILLVALLCIPPKASYEPNPGQE